MDIEYSKKKRKLTTFLCGEMLYEYLTNQLDPIRRESVKEFLAINSDLRDDLANLANVQKYCAELSTAKLSDSCLIEIQSQNSLISKILKSLSWGQLPEIIKWAVEGLSLAIAVALFTIFMPWGKILNILPQEKLPFKNVANTEKLDPSGTRIDKIGIESQVTQLMRNKFEGHGPSQADDIKTNTGESTGVKVKTEKFKPIGQKKAVKGELYRAFMNLNDIERVTEEITNKILSIGGEKAGKVRIGWRKKDGSYFHFALDAKKLDELNSFLKSYGALRINTEAHWRVMEEGKVRIILLVKDSDYKE